MLNELKTFIAVTQYGTFSGAGARIGLTQSAVSAQMQRVGAIASAQVSLLADALARFRDDRPGWRIRVVPGVSLGLLGQVDSGELDLAIIIKPPFALPSELEWRTLVAEPFVLLAPKKLARGGRSWRELLRSEPFIRSERASFGGRLVDRFLRRSRLNVRDVIELDELQAIVQLVAHGIGVALIPKSVGLGKWPARVAAL